MVLGRDVRHGTLLSDKYSPIRKTAFFSCPALDKLDSKMISKFKKRCHLFTHTHWWYRISIYLWNQNQVSIQTHNDDNGLIQSLPALLALEWNVLKMSHCIPEHLTKPILFDMITYLIRFWTKIGWIRGSYYKSHLHKFLVTWALELKWLTHPISCISHLDRRLISG